MEKTKSAQMIKAIQDGLMIGYFEYGKLKKSHEGFEKKMTEYFLTVSVANELNNLMKSDYKKQINLEYPLWKFYMNAFPKITFIKRKGTTSGLQIKKSKYAKKQSKHLIDIVVAKSEPLLVTRSVYGIELKAINTSYLSIVKDLRRLSEAMILKDDSDSNSISKCYSGFIKFYRNKKGPTTKRELKSLRTVTTNEIESLLTGKFRNKTRYQLLQYRINTSEIDVLSSEKYKERFSNSPDFIPDYYEAKQNTGEVMSFVIEIKR